MSDDTKRRLWAAARDGGEALEMARRVLATIEKRQREAMRPKAIAQALEEALASGEDPPPAPPPSEAPDNADEIEPRPESMFPTADELAEFLEAAPPLLRLAVKLQFASGLSRAQVVALRWEDIDFAAGTIRTRGGLLALSDEMRAALADVERDPGPRPTRSRRGKSPPQEAGGAVCGYVIVESPGVDLPSRQVDAQWSRTRWELDARWRRLPQPRAEPATVPPRARGNVVTLRIVAEQSAGGWTARVEEMPGVSASGATEVEAVRGAKAAALRAVAERDEVPDAVEFRR